MQQPHQQLVEVKSANQPRALQWLLSALPLGFIQGPQFGLTSPAEQQRLKRPQYAPQGGFRSLGAFRHQRNPSESYA